MQGPIYRMPHCAPKLRVAPMPRARQTTRVSRYGACAGVFADSWARAMTYARMASTSLAESIFWNEGIPLEFSRAVHHRPDDCIERYRWGLHGLVERRFSMRVPRR